MSDVVDKIDGYCNQINFAKTPFNVSVFVVLWDSDNNFVPQNEGIVMQNYLEVLLEKLSPKESDRSTYSFKIKQHFLSNFAYKMFRKNEYFFTEEEFSDYVYKYHKDKGYKECDSKFSKLFFEKGILSISTNLIVFSHTSILEYYLAVYAKENNDFLQCMLKKGNRVHFRNEICFYSGLTLNCSDLLDRMAETIIETIIENIDIVDKLNNLEIMTTFKMEKNELIKRLNENRPTQNEIDKLSDIENAKNEISPTDFCKKKKAVQIEAPKLIIDIEKDREVKTEEETEDLFSLLQMYGSVLKNAELLDNKYKVIHLENYMYAMNILLGEFLQILEVVINNMSKDDFKDYLSNSPEDHSPEVSSNEEFEKMKNTFIELTKISLPIALQKMILENVGTPKLELAINELMIYKKNKPFEKFMLIFLKCDQKIGNVCSELNRYIQEETSESILKLITTKLVFYYKMRFLELTLKWTTIFSIYYLKFKLLIPKTM